jgi:hypothetical protein
MTENFDRVMQWVDALLAKTTAAGATEQEAAAAAEKAAQLVRKYQLDLGAERVKREGFVLRDVCVEGYSYTFAACAGFGISVLCEVKVWLSKGGRGLPSTVWILGLRSDVELAHHLFTSLAPLAVLAADAHLNKLQPGSAGEARSARHAFVVGYAGKVSERLKKMAHDREVANRGGTGTAIVPLDKKSLVDAEFKRRNIQLRRGSAGSISDRAAYEAGAAQGDRAGIGRPVKDGRVVGLIGHSNGRGGRGDG